MGVYYIFDDMERMGGTGRCTGWASVSLYLCIRWKNGVCICLCVCVCRKVRWTRHAPWAFEICQAIGQLVWARRYLYTIMLITAHKPRRICMLCPRAVSGPMADVYRNTSQIHASDWSWRHTFQGAAELTLWACKNGASQFQISGETRQNISTQDENCKSSRPIYYRSVFQSSVFYTPG